MDGSEASQPRTRRAAMAGAAGLFVLLPLLWMATGRAADDAAVSLEAARAALEQGTAIVIDIREPAEHAGGVAPGARLLPLRQWSARIGEVPTQVEKPVLLICNTQNRSRAALKLLRDAGGYGHVRYVEGGMSEWARRGWPMVRPSP